MRVLHFYRTYFPDSFGGIEQLIYQLCRGGTKLSVSNSVLSLTRQRAARTLFFDGHEAHRVRMNFEIASTSFSASAFTTFYQLAKKADIVHYHYPWPFMDVVHFAARLKKPTVVTYHSDIVRQEMLLKLYGPLQRRFLASVDRIVATSPNYLASSRVLNRYRDKATVIPIGLDKSSYPAVQPDLLTKWRTQVGEKFFLFVGLLRYYKGLHILLEAAQSTNYPVVIVGAGPVERELTRQVARLQLKHVQFLGALPDQDKVALLQLCYAVVFPSQLRSEAFGIALLEGAMYGKPMISTEIGTGTSYINESGKTGLVVPPNDPLALRQAMRNLWENPGLAHEMGTRAEQRYWDFFTADRMVASYAELYNDMLARHRYHAVPFAQAAGRPRS
jgi:rhamnosyl/mannosyltransferase